MPPRKRRPHARWAASAQKRISERSAPFWKGAAVEDGLITSLARTVRRRENNYFARSEPADSTLEFPILR